jgi:NADP-dependent 3-hydroxy acid dehydrogenase YdfG
MDTTLPLAGRTALVTGASSGIGAATARHLAAVGAHVVLVARRAERLHALADEVGGAALPVDITRPDGLANLADRAGDVDLLVNNAAIMLPNPLSGGATSEWDQMLGLNLAALLHVTHACLPGLLRAAAAGTGADIVNVSSTGADTATPAFAVYGATKAAVSHLSAALRGELTASGVRVTDVKPGGVDTELLHHATNPEIRARLMAAPRSMRLLDADDVADAITYAVTRPAHVCLSSLTVVPAAPGR